MVSLGSDCGTSSLFGGSLRYPMIHITLGAEREIDPSTDDLGRDRVGFAPTMSPLALYDAMPGGRISVSDWMLAWTPRRPNASR